MKRETTARTLSVAASLIVAGLEVAAGAHRLGQRPPDVGLAVGDAAALQHEAVVAPARHLRDLLDDPRLADAGVADEQEQRGAALADREVERVGEERNLVVTADERRPVTVGAVAGW